MGGTKLNLELNLLFLLFPSCGLTGGVVSDAVEHLRTGSRHHLPGAAPGPAGADAIDGGVAVESRVWSEGGGGGQKCQTQTHIPGMAQDYI